MSLALFWNLNIFHNNNSSMILLLCVFLFLFFLMSMVVPMQFNMLPIRHNFMSSSQEIIKHVQFLCVRVAMMVKH